MGTTIRGATTIRRLPQGKSAAALALNLLRKQSKSAFAGISDYPQLAHGDIETPDVGKIGAFVKDLTGCGALTPDESLEGWLREIGGMPPRLDV